MRDKNDRVVAAIFVLGLLALLLAWLDRWALFGLVTCAVLVLGLALGYGAARRTRAIGLSLALLFAGYALMLGGMVFGDATALRLVRGLPLGTALLVYGIWPLPLLAGLLYALVFRSSVLPPDKLEKFLAEHGRRNEAR